MGKKLYTKRNISKSKTQLLDIPELLVLDEGSDDTHLKTIHRRYFQDEKLACPACHSTKTRCSKVVDRKFKDVLWLDKDHKEFQIIDLNFHQRYLRCDECGKSVFPETTEFSDKGCRYTNRLSDALADGTFQYSYKKVCQHYGVPASTASVGEIMRRRIQYRESLLPPIRTPHTLSIVETIFFGEYYPAVLGIWDNEVYCLDILKDSSEETCGAFLKQLDASRVETVYVDPVEVTAETPDRIYRGDGDGELLYIALHGDYKYGALKNTASELDAQNDVFVSALSYELEKRDLLVIGYSGRDKSLMAALASAYQKKGTGKLFWCGYGNNPPEPVKNLIQSVNENGRSAFYVPTDGFDKTLYSLARYCMSEDADFLRKIDVLKKELASAVSEFTSNFETPIAAVGKITNTNVYPITFPKSCYQLEVKLNQGEKPWDFCKYLASNDVMAVPHNNFLYAWGEKDKIQTLCSGRMIGELSLTPFTRDNPIKIGSFNELLLKTVTAIIGRINSLPYSKDKVWDTTQNINKCIGNRTIVGYKGVRFSLFFDTKYSYITATPTFIFDSDINLSREEKKQFADSFTTEVNLGKPNLNVYEYIDKWIKRLFGQNGIQATFPPNAATSFVFNIRPKSVILGVSTGSQYQVRIPQTISEKRIVFKGMECRDTDLIFFNPAQNRIAKDFHPMRGLINNAPFDYSLNNNILRSSISLGVICPSAHNQRFHSFLNQLNSRQGVKYNLEYVIPFPGFFEAFKTNLSIPATDTNAWLDVTVPQSYNIYDAAVDFGKSLCKSLDRLSASSVDVALIYIPKEYEPLTGYVDDNENFDLHDYVKAYAAQRNIATQFVREKTLESDMNCQIMWALSLAIYVKSSRIPWVVSGINNETAFAGIGYSLNRTGSNSNVVVGCSHIYSADGQGMKYKLSRIDDCTFDHKKNPYLSEDEAYRLGLNIKELFYKSFSEMPKRVVIHKRTPFRRDEIKGLVTSLSSAGIKDIDLLEITLEDDLKCFEFTRNMDAIDGFPVRRGLCFPLNGNTMYLYTHGIAPSVRNSNYRYIQGGKTIPLPLKIVKHHGNGTLPQIATEILGLSKMNWNSFGLYSKLPCTIDSSNEIARIGRLLSQYEGAIYEYRYFM